MKKSETQEQEFLEVCSSYDHDLLTGKREMTLKDYERITYLVSSLGYSQYLQFLIGKYMDLSQADEEREEREHTLAVNINRLRKKIETEEHSYISNVYGMGYIWK